MHADWNRLNLLSGILFVVLVAVGFGMIGLSGTDDGGKIATDFAVHRDRVMFGGYLVCLGLVALVMWGWGWRTLLAESPRGATLGLLVFVAVVLSAAVEFPVPALYMSLAYISNQAVDPQIARAMASSAQVFSYVDYFPTILMFSAMGWAILTTNTLNRWFGWAAFVAAAVSVVVAYPLLGADVGGAIVDLLWIIPVSIALYLSAAAKGLSSAG